MPEGADTIVWLAVPPAAEGRTGRFFFDRQAVRTHWLPMTRESQQDRNTLWRIEESKKGRALDVRDLVRVVGCHGCDAVVEEPFVPDGGSAICGRCGETLFRRQRQTVEITLALSISGAILFIVANVYPFLAFELQGQVAHTTLRSGVSALWEQGQYAVGCLVLLTTMLAPALELSLLLFVLTPIYFRWPSRGGIQVFRWLEMIRAWSMMEVFLIGILVALVKLSDMAEIVPGLALWAFALLIPVLAGALAFLDAEMVWRELEVPQ